jgi:TetR/AcrR family transcriptional regulator, cholesterol catabolism regulator
MKKNSNGDSQTEERILQAAATLFAVHGYYGTGIRAIADESGVTVSTLYHYMQSKDELLQSIMEFAFGSLVDMGNDVLECTDDTVGRLARLIEGHVAINALNRITVSVLTNEARVLTGDARDRVLEMRRTYQGIWQTILDQGKEEGVFDIGDVPLTRLALLEMCTGVGIWFSPAGRLSVDDVCLEFVNLGLKMVGACRPETHDPLTFDDLSARLGHRRPEFSRFRTEPSGHIIRHA